MWVKDLWQLYEGLPDSWSMPPEDATLLRWTYVPDSLDGNYLMV